MIPASNITAITVSAGISVLFPLVALAWFRRKTKVSFRPALFGAATFFVFALMLEQLLHYAVFTNYPSIRENAVAFTAYASLAAGIFEECGRYFTYSFFLKRNREWKDGVAFGIGHGGMESLMVGGLGMIGIIITALMLNDGSIMTTPLTSEQKTQLNDLRTQLTETGWPYFLLGGIERTMAFVVQIGLSLMVLLSVRRRKINLLIAAILLHALLDVGAALYQAKVLHILAVELIVLVFAVASFIFIRRSAKFFLPDAPSA